MTKEIVTDSSDSTMSHSRFSVDVMTAVINEAMYVDPFLLSDDSPADIFDGQILFTIVNGVIVYER